MAGAAARSVGRRTRACSSSCARARSSASASLLASGRESDFFIDCKQAVLTAEGHALVGAAMLDALARLPACDAVAGVELGGCPLASAVALTSFQRGAPLDAVYVRKDAKDHGSRRTARGQHPPGRRARASCCSKTW